MQTATATTTFDVVELDSAAIDPTPWSWITQRASDVDADAGAAIQLALDVGHEVAPPGTGRTAERWSVLATMGAQDLTAARVAEAHLDALAILSEAGLDPQGGLGGINADGWSSWGVFAAEGPAMRVEATGSDSAGWRLEGVKPWCSLAGHLTHALVTAYTPDDARRLFAIDLRDCAVHVTEQGWYSRGLNAVPSMPITLSGAPALPVGIDGWYLRRPGFAWGGAGVAACWYGGAVGVARLLWDRCTQRPADQIAQMHLGAIDLVLAGARSALRHAAYALDAGEAEGGAGVLIAARTRGLVAAAAEETLRRVGHALGPAPLTQDDRHARRVADLEVYVRQYHAERDEAALGRTLLAGVRPW